jgi:hypothetical protein
MKFKTIVTITASVLLASCASVEQHSVAAHKQVSDSVIAEQRQRLKENTKGKGFGPQAPRDLNSHAGKNRVKFNSAPASSGMNLCNIHFHKNAEHKGGEFTKFAGNGDGHGYQSGYKYSGHLTAAELTPVDEKICANERSRLFSGDTIEVHYVYSTAQVEPEPSLEVCFNEFIHNPQLRVETQVYVLVNDGNGQNFANLTQYGIRNNFYQALNIPNTTGLPIQYSGSTTGPDYNEKGSPLQVTWSIRPKIVKVNIKTVGKWCTENIFKESYGHGVRNLVKNPELLSIIKD